MRRIDNTSLGNAGRRRKILVIERDATCFNLVCSIVRLSDPTADFDWVKSCPEAWTAVNQALSSGLGYDLVIVNPRMQAAALAKLQDSRVLVTTVLAAALEESPEPR
jgi:hypothetical protein